MVLSTSKITTKRQITLPLKVMNRLKLHPGDNIVFEENNGHIEVKNISAKFTIDDLVKKYKGKAKIKASDEDIRKARIAGWSSRYKK